MISLLPISACSRDVSACVEIALGPCEVHGVELPALSVVRVRGGVLWVTCEGDGADHLLTAGMELRTLERGRVVLQALRGPGVVVLSIP